MFDQPSTICQSCGLPIEDGKYGMNPEGTYNWDYCNRCYDDGEFLEPTVQMEEMIDRSARRMEEDTGISEDDAKLKLKKLFPTLKRWNEAW